MSYTDPNEHVEFKDRLGSCYVFAAQYALANHSTLVHGSIQGMGKPRLDHAWVENTDGSVWEPTTGFLFGADEGFESFASPIVHTRYKPEEVSLLALQEQHWGPWDSNKEEPNHE